jgi:hypothetical protein
MQNFSVRHWQDRQISPCARAFRWNSSMASAFAFLAIVLSAAAQSPGARKFFLYAGSSTNSGTSKGIYVYRYDSTSGMTEPLGLAAESPNPTFLAVHPNHRFLYAVNEISNFAGPHRKRNRLFHRCRDRQVDAVERGGIPGRRPHAPVH